MTAFATPNLFLGVIALASLLEMLAVAAVGIGFFLLTRRVSRLIDVVEREQLSPAANQLHSILEDVKDVTGTARRIFGVK